METQLPTTEQSIATTEQLSEILVQKRNNWATLGQSVHFLEIELQTQCSLAISSIKFPTNIEDVPVAEEQLKSLKRTKAEAETKRKTATSRLDSISQRLMQPEKSLLEPEKKLTAAIISVKKEHEIKLKQDAERIAQLKQCRELLLNFNTKVNSDFQQRISDLINNAYSHALGEGSITMEGLSDYLLKVESRVTVDSLKITIPTKSYSLVTDEEYTALGIELVKVDTDTIIADFKEKLNYKFSDYSIAVNNKMAALEIARKEKEEQDKKILEEKQASDIAAKLQSLAETPVVNAVPTKALKSEYKIDMEETLENSILVMTAFVTNITLIKPMIRVNKFDSFNIGQMKTYLCKCKTMDDNFNFTGITFKTIDKL